MPGASFSAGGPKSPAALQLEVMDFSDRYVNGLWFEIDGAFADEPDPARRVAALAWKLRYGSASMEIAAGADPRTNLLDMAIFISAGEWALDRYWIPEVFGEQGDGLRRHYREMNRRVWELVGETLTEEQIATLRALVDRWLATSPPRYEVASIRFRNLDGVHAADFEPEQTASGLLASVRRWLGEVNTSLLFGERMLFYVERTPRILNQQTDLTLAQIANDFPITTFQPDLNALTTYLETFPEKLQASLAENPDFTRDVLAPVAGTITEARELVAGTTELVTSTKELTTSLNTTLDRLKALSVPQGEGVESARPIDVQASLDQAEAALASLDSSVAGLNELLATDDLGESKLSLLVNRLDDSADRWLERAFGYALWILGLFFGGLAALLILARLLFARSNAAGSGPEH